jgi:hypothetical protein
MKRDEHGYVNNIGKSKYWGVTTNTSESGSDFWAVSYQPQDGDSTTHSLTARDFTLREVDAARFASAIYETGRRKTSTVKLKVLCEDGLFVMRLRGNAIYREPYTDQDVYVPNPDFDKVEVEEPVTDVDIKHVKRHAKGDDEYTANLARMILDGNISKSAAKLLIGILKLKK